MCLTLLGMCSNVYIDYVSLFGNCVSLFSIWMNCGMLLNLNLLVKHCGVTYVCLVLVLVFLLWKQVGKFFILGHFLGKISSQTGSMFLK